MILVATYSSRYCVAIKKFVEDLGYHALATTDGEDAWEIYRGRKKELELAILDANLPHKSGVSIMQEIRAGDPKFPIILLFRSEQKHFIEEENVHCLNNPVDREVLRELVIETTMFG
ncbi:MAG: response regulator [Phycisphaera sp.]|nr:response regulator [Phycisphaera sp.]